MIIYLHLPTTNQLYSVFQSSLNSYFHMFFRPKINSLLVVSFNNRGEYFFILEYKFEPDLFMLPLSEFIV